MLPPKGLRRGLPEICHFGSWIIFSWRQLRRWLHKKVFSLPERIWAGVLPIIRAATRNDFVCPIYRTGHTSNYWASVLLWMTFLPLKSQGTLSVLSAECHLYFIFTFCLWTSHTCIWGSIHVLCKYIWPFSFVNLSHVYLTLNQLKEPRRIEEIFSPPTPHMPIAQTHVAYWKPGCLVVYVAPFHHAQLSSRGLERGLPSYSNRDWATSHLYGSATHWDSEWK